MRLAAYAWTNTGRAALGACLFAVSGAGCGDSGSGGTISGCPAGTRACGPICATLTSDPANCGACGVVCGAGQSCTSGACTCQAGLTSCGATCANLNGDGENCGACGQRCATGLVCSAGTCGSSCTVPGETMCGSSCVNLATSPTSCGACGQACAAGETCVASACTCPTGTTRCGAACLDLTQDPANCGACGQACGAGQSCRAGSCVGGGTGGASTGGAGGTGGGPTGGVATGGQATGGQATGGQATGGQATGGQATGGQATGGVGTGGQTCGVGATPVARHGQLRVSGRQLVDQCGNTVQLKGPSSMWLNWEDDGFAESRAALQWMRDNWNATVIRAAMGIEPEGAYLQDQAKARRQVATIVENAIDLGVYVIIDWHDHNAQNHQSQASTFFADMAATYGDHPNVLYETYNEPLAVSWTGVLKPYHQAIVGSIRGNDPDNVIILGTPNWSQGVLDAAASPVSGTNLMYTLHFYACSHTGWLRSDAEDAYNQGLPMFVTEWGATNADGGLDGAVCESEATQWHDLLDRLHISWAAWKLDACSDSSCILSSGASRDGNWTNLHGHGNFVVSRMRTNPM